MSTYDFRTMVDGEPVDPLADGGTVGTLKLYSTAARVDPPVTTVATAERVSAGRYRFTVPDSTTPAGRYYARVTWTAETGGPTITDNVVEPADMPNLGMVADPEDLAVQLGIALPLTTAQRDALAVAIADAQADVEGYLGRSVMPTLISERRLWPQIGGWVLAEQPVVEVLSEVEEFEDSIATGYWTVHYLAGLDARNDLTLRPIRRVLLAHAATQPSADILWRTVGSGAVATVGKRVKSVSAEGQSVSYEYQSAAGGPTNAAGTVGGAPLWASIDRWRLAGRRVIQRRAPAYWVR